MKTITAIMALAADEPPEAPMAMATVVNVQGSAYRRPGARMLITSAGRTAGTISGGCLENDVRERAAFVMKTGEPCVVVYDSTAPEDIVFGLGLGCNGVVQVLIERLTAGGDGLLSFLSTCLECRQTGRIATVFQSEGIPPGTRLMQWPDGRVTGCLNDAVLSAALVDLLKETSAKHTCIRAITLPDGREARVLLETVTPPLPFVVCGAGDDALPLVSLAKLVGWHVTVIDARPAFACPTRFPLADKVLCIHPEFLETCTQVVFQPETMCVIMTHSFARDREFLRFLLPLPVKYLGVLGPKDRTNRLLSELAFTEKPPAHLHSPVGLDIGAETPEEIAISIIGEMQAALTHRDGRPLRNRPGPIHNPTL